MIFGKQKQPHGFSTFFLTEMWERYGFYVLQTLLVFYAIQKIKLNDADTYILVGSFTALAYVNSIFGGLIADRYIGYERAILSGAALLCCGYVTLTLANNNLIFMLGLAIITVGTGLLKPNISSMLSVLYRNNPQAKEVGYTLFYVGIYFGAIGGSFIGGFIKNYFGWFAVFGSAAIGLAIALISFYYGKAKYNLHDPRTFNYRTTDFIKAILAILFLIFTAFFGVQNEFLSNLFFIIISIAGLIFLAHNIKIYQALERSRLIAFSILVVFSGLYWAVYFQQFFSISLCTARVTAISLPESSLTAFESLGVIVFGPLLNLFWLFLQRHNRDLSIPAKFSLSFLFNGISFFILVIGLEIAIRHGALQQQVFIILAYFSIALGELFIAPIGLAMVSTLVPQRLQGAMMGIFLMSIGIGGKLAGLLAQSAVSDTTTNILQLQLVYRNSFALYCLFSLAIFILSLIAIYPVNRLIRGKSHD